MVSFIITAWKEEDTIGKSIESLVKPDYSGYYGPFELIVVAPDYATRDAAKRKVTELDIMDKYTYIRDEAKGKPIALNLVFQKAKGEILVLTDGEVFFQNNASKALIDKLVSSDKIGGVSGRPVTTNSRDSLYGYLAHQQTDAVHNMRENRPDFPMSGYIMALRNLKYVLPEDLYLDDAYISNVILGENLELAYEPDAKVNVKYPTTFEEFKQQKFRSTIGMKQLENYEEIEVPTSRSFFSDLKYVFFPLTYAKSLKELFWSFSHYFIRLYLWIYSWMNRDKAKGKNIRDVYVRTETTK